MGKADELVPFPVKDQLPGVDVCVTSSPPWAEAIILGFQHYIVMLGTTIIIPSILVPLMGGGNVERVEVINSMLFVSGISTLLQTSFGSRLPVVVGGSYAFVIPAISIALRENSRTSSVFLTPHQRFDRSMSALQGALIISSTIHVFIALSGLWRIFARFLSPLAAVPLIVLTGLGLYTHGFPQLAKCVELGLPALFLLIIFSQFVPHMWKSRGSFVGRFAVLISVAFAWGLAVILTGAGAYSQRSLNTQINCRTDRSGLLRAAPWIRFPVRWRGPTFNAGDVFAMMAACFVAVIESIGTMIAAARLGSATPTPPSVLGRGIGFLGLGTLLAGLFGAGTGLTASVENAGLLGLTRVGSRKVVQISACFMLFFSFFGKFGAILASIPLPIVAALYCVLFAYVVSAGLGFLQFCNLNSFRTKFILGFSIFMGLSVPQYFNEHVLVSGRGPVHTGAIWFNDIMQVIFTSAATVGIIVAYFLDRTHSLRHSDTYRDSGRHWWKKFTSYDADLRTEDFYSLPYNFNRFFPSH